MREYKGVKIPIIINRESALAAIQRGLCRPPRACRGIACEECLFSPENQLEFNKIILGEKE